ncbi:MAG TPA: gfo/Idh/MocA family oxidoreductase, partial [Chthonomonadales bacterium]|nr:gfo/Idh/MocA family oxidoreductase [Chthonomonadales bacterium]
MGSTGQIGIALLSFAHVHARGYADQVRDIPDTYVACVWDEDPDRGQTEAGRIGAEFVPEIDKALEHSGVQAVVINA